MWRLILPTIGLLLFGLETYESYREWQVQHSPGRYFWWSFIQLDSDPLSRHPRLLKQNNAGWDLRYKIVDPGYLANTSFLSGLPAFLASAVVFRGLSHFGVSQVLSFMISTPILLFAWYYFLGWLVDRWRGRRNRRIVNTLA